jgi:hypothetical protein
MKGVKDLISLEVELSLLWARLRSSQWIVGQAHMKTMINTNYGVDYR